MADAADPRSLFGTKLLQARKRAHLSQAALATRIGSTQAYVSRAERGLENPPLLTCAAFAEALNCRFIFAFDVGG